MNGGSEKDLAVGEMTSGRVSNGKPRRHTRPEAGNGDERRRGAWSGFFGIDAGNHILALLDQAVVSGTSFLTTVLIGRWCGAGELGVYALGFSLLLSWGCVHQSLIALPYTIYRHRTPWGTQEEYAGSALIHNGLLSALALIVLAASAGLLSLGSPVAGLVAVLWALVGVMPFALLREFSRRFAFAHLRMAQALVLDLAVAGVQLSGLAWLASTETLSATTAYGAFGLGCALSGAVWLYLDRAHFSLRWNKVWPTMQQSWSLGKWLFASQVTVWLQAYFVHWLLACVLGATATGVYAACMTVVMFSNPLLLGISNALAPRAAQAFVDGGAPQLQRVVFQTTLLLAAAMALFCALVLLAGEDIMGLLYHGSQYEGHGNTVFVLALAMLASALGMPATNGLAAAERPDLTFKAGLLAVAVSILLVPWLVMKWGVGGAAFGFLAGTTIGSLGRWAGFLAVLRLLEHARVSGSRHASARQTQAEVIRVVEEFVHGSESTDWVIEWLSEGVQASIFAVSRADGQQVWQTHNQVAIKLYKAAGPHDVDAVHRQVAALFHFHTRLSGSTIHGWEIQSPVVLHQCDAPLALVMTVVPGQSLNSLLATSNQVTTEILESIAHAVAATLERYWLVDRQIHGDLNFDNILCDLAARTLSFVDPGVVENTLLCDQVDKRWYPASRDLAYLLFDTSVSLKRTIGNPAARRRQQWMLDRVLRAFLTRIGSAGPKNSLLDEIQACARVQLNRLDLSWSPRGLWRLFLSRTASRNIHRILDKLRAETAFSAETPQ